MRGVAWLPRGAPCGTKVARLCPRLKRWTKDGSGHVPTGLDFTTIREMWMEKVFDGIQPFRPGMMEIDDEW
jgi:hypothetical protein